MKIIKGIKVLPSLLLGAYIAFTLQACEEEFSYENLVEKQWHKILSIKESGEQTITLSGKATAGSTTKSVIVLKGGSKKSATAAATLAVISTAELNVLFPDNSYQIISTDMYDFDKEVRFAADEAGKQIPITLNQSAIVQLVRGNANTTMVLPLKLVSQVDSVNANKNYTLLTFEDGDKPRAIDGTMFEFPYQNVPTNLWGSFAASNLFDGDIYTVWRTVPWYAKTVVCNGVGYNNGNPESYYNASAFWCNKEDHDISDYTYSEFYNKDEQVSQPVYLPWILVIDMKKAYDIVEINTTRFVNTFEGGVDLSSFYQRVKDYEYWVSNDYTDDNSWVLVGQGSMPVYGEQTYNISSDQSVSHVGRYLKLVITSLHWREKSVDEIQELYGTTYNKHHSWEFCSNRQSVAKDPDYAKFKKSAAVDLGPVILGEIEVIARDID